MPDDEKRIPSLEPLVLTNTDPKRELRIGTDLKTGSFSLNRDGKASEVGPQDLPKLHKIVAAFGGEDASGHFLEWLSKRAALMVALRRHLAANAPPEEEDDEEE